MSPSRTCRSTIVSSDTARATRMPIAKMTITYRPPSMTPPLYVLVSIIPLYGFMFRMNLFKTYS